MSMGIIIKYEFENNKKRKNEDEKRKKVGR